jgi:hypothetical protein
MPVLVGPDGSETGGCGCVFGKTERDNQKYVLLQSRKFDLHQKKVAKQITMNQ